MSEGNDAYEVITCPECGATVDHVDPGKDARCEYCGALLHDLRPGPRRSGAPPRPAPARRRRPPSKRVVTAAIAGAALVALFVTVEAWSAHVQATRTRYGWFWDAARPVVVDVDGDGVDDLVAPFEAHQGVSAVTPHVFVGAFDGNDLSHRFYEIGPFGTLFEAQGHLAIAVTGDHLVVVEPAGRVATYGLADGSPQGTALLDDTPTGRICITPDRQVWTGRLLLDPESGVSHAREPRPDDCTAAGTSTGIRLTGDPDHLRATRISGVGHGRGRDPQYHPHPVPELEGYHFVAIRERGSAAVGVARGKVGARNPILLGFDPDTGTERWRAPLSTYAAPPGGATEGAPARHVGADMFADIVDGHFVFAPRVGGMLHVVTVDPATGKQLGDTPLGTAGHPWGYTASGDMLYLAVQGGGPKDRRRTPDLDPPIAVIDLGAGQLAGWWGSEHP